MTAEQRLFKWNKIFDLATCWVEECLEVRNGKGAGFASDMASRSLAVIGTLETIGNKGDDKPIEINLHFASIPEDETPADNEPSS